MKSIVSLLAIVCMTGCVLQEAEHSTDGSAGMQPTSSGGGNYIPVAGSPAQRCTAKSVFVVNTPEGPVVVEVAANCNPSVGPDVGDPAPDYVSDPNPWEKNLNGTKVNPSLDTKR